MAGPVEQEVERQMKSYRRESEAHLAALDRKFPVHQNGKVRPALTPKDKTFFVDEKLEKFMEKVKLGGMSGSLRLHFREGKLTKPTLWTEKNT